MAHAISGNPRVLAVEYDAERRRELTQRLQQWRFDHRFVAGGAAALGALRAAVRDGNPYVIAIIARDMPRIDGLGLIDAVHADVRIRATRLILRGEVVDDTLFAHSRRRDLQVALDDYDGLLAALRLCAGGDADDGAAATAAAASGADDGPVFDRAAFGERLGDDAALMRTVAEVFVGDLSELLGKLREFAASGDWRGAGVIGHQVKGSAANVGGMALSAQAGRIEHAGRGGDGDRVVAALDELQRRFDSLRAEMRRQLG